MPFILYSFVQLQSPIQGREPLLSGEYTLDDTPNPSHYLYENFIELSVHEVLLCVRMCTFSEKRVLQGFIGQLRVCVQISCR